MPYPAESGLDTFASNRMENVQAYLDAKHPRNYTIYNLSPRSYSSERFEGRVAHRNLDPSCSPSLRDIFEICNNMRIWLRQSAGTLCVLHCLDGKAISATICCAFICYCRLFSSAKEALQLFCDRRGLYPGMSPSQIR